MHRFVTTLLLLVIALGLGAYILLVESNIAPINANGQARPCRLHREPSARTAALRISASGSPHIAVSASIACNVPGASDSLSRRAAAIRSTLAQCSPRHSIAEVI